MERGRLGRIPDREPRSGRDGRAPWGLRVGADIFILMGAAPPHETLF